MDIFSLAKPNNTKVCTTKKTLLLLSWLLLAMNQLTAQSILNKAEKHHTNWQQPVEGVVIASYAEGNTHYSTAGLTRADGIKPDKHTVFEIGSITKVFTAILLAEAVRDNLAGFDDPISTHLSDLEFKKKSPFHSITLSQLATHTSGLPRLPVDLASGADNKNPYAHNDEKRLRSSLITFRKNQLETPGEHSYSNYGAGILGYVLSQIYGQSYRDLLKTKILDPLNMTSTVVPTRFADLPDVISKRIASPHVAGKTVSHWELASLAGAGGMVSTAEDMIRFGKAHWSKDTPNGLAASLLEVAKPRLDHQGLGWGIDGDSPSHGGGTGGFRTFLKVNPVEKTVQVFLSNSAGASSEVSIKGDFSKLQGYWSGTLEKESESSRLVSYISKEGRMIVYSIDQNNNAALSTKARIMDDKFYITFPLVPAVYEGTVKRKPSLVPKNTSESGSTSVAALASALSP